VKITRTLLRRCGCGNRSDHIQHWICGSNRSRAEDYVRVSVQLLCDLAIWLSLVQRRVYVVQGPKVQELILSENRLDGLRGERKVI
jgi:hypothetical protein